MTSSPSSLDSALDLLLRLPPQQVTRNLANISRLAPELQDDLESATDQPLTTAVDPCSCRQYILCEYNRDASSHRSPWCNTYHPELPDGYKPNGAMRHLEMNCNESFNKYLDLYYDGGVASAYIWPVDSHFAAAILFTKGGNGNGKIRGRWDSIHVVEIKPSANTGYSKTPSTCYEYTMTSTVMLWLETNKDVSGLMNIGGCVSRQTRRTTRLHQSSSHVINVGGLVEEQENHMRAQLYDIYFWKTKDVVTRCLRSPVPLKTQQEQRRNSRMLDASKAVIRRTPSGKHLMVPAGDSIHV